MNQAVDVIAKGQEAFGHLTEEDRAAIRKRLSEGESLEEIVATIGKPAQDMEKAGKTPEQWDKEVRRAAAKAKPRSAGARQARKVTTGAYKRPDSARVKAAKAKLAEIMGRTRGYAGRARGHATRAAQAIRQHRGPAAMIGGGLALAGGGASALYARRRAARMANARTRRRSDSGPIEGYDDFEGAGDTVYGTGYRVTEGARGYEPVYLNAQSMDPAFDRRIPADRPDTQKSEDVMMLASMKTSGDQTKLLKWAAKTGYNGVVKHMELEPTVEDPVGMTNELFKRAGNLGLARRNDLMKAKKKKKFKPTEAWHEARELRARKLARQIGAGKPVRTQFERGKPLKPRLQRTYLQLSPEHARSAKVGWKVGAARARKGGEQLITRGLRYGQAVQQQMRGLGAAAMHTRYLPAAYRRIGLLSKPQGAGALRHALLAAQGVPVVGRLARPLPAAALAAGGAYLYGRRKVRQARERSVGKMTKGMLIDTVAAVQRANVIVK